MKFNKCHSYALRGYEFSLWLPSRREGMAWCAAAYMSFWVHLAPPSNQLCRRYGHGKFLRLKVQVASFVKPVLPLNYNPVHEEICWNILLYIVFLSVFIYILLIARVYGFYSSDSIQKNICSSWNQWGKRKECQNCLINKRISLKELKLCNCFCYRTRSSCQFDAFLALNPC